MTCVDFCCWLSSLKGSCIKEVTLQTFRKWNLKIWASGFYSKIDTKQCLVCYVMMTSLYALVGVNFNNKLNFDCHIKELCCKAWSKLNVFQYLITYLDLSVIWPYSEPSFYRSPSIVLCIYEYRALRFVYMDFWSSYDNLMSRADYLYMCIRIVKKQLNNYKEIFRAKHHLSPAYMWDLFTEWLTPYNPCHIISIHVKKEIL